MLRKEVGDRLAYQKKIRIGIPGIQTLHSRSSNEIGDVLFDIINSEDNVTEIKYVLGKYIELVIKDTSPDKFIQVY